MLLPFLPFETQIFRRGQPPCQRKILISQPNYVVFSFCESLFIMKRISFFSVFAGIIALSATFIAACQQTPTNLSQAERDALFEKQLVINEIMASNRTGLQRVAGGEPCDWLEIKNVSKEAISLKGYTLLVTNAEKDSMAADTTATQKEEPKEKVKDWNFPDVTLQPGEHLLVFTKKKSDGKTTVKGAFVANIKMAGRGARIQLVTPQSTIASEVTFPDLQADEAYVRGEDGKFHTSYYPTPGQANSDSGYEASAKQVEAGRRSPLLIWELMSRAEKNSENWVEVKNVSDQPVQLGEYALATKTEDNNKQTEASKPIQWAFPEETIQPGEIRVIRLRGKKATDAQKEANIKLGNAETLLLLHKGKFADGVCAKGTVQGSSIGRTSNGVGLFYFTSPTMGAENPAVGFRTIAPAPQFDKQSGVYNKVGDMVLHLIAGHSKVHYTTDGTLPTKDSPLLADSLRISKSMVLRTFDEGDSTRMRSAVSTHTFILGEKHDLPVVTITAAPADLYSHNSGLCADGPGFTPEFPHKGANYWKPMSKPAHLAIIETDGTRLETNFDLRIFGGFSRALPKKSFYLKFNNRYGSREIAYDFFGEGEAQEYRSIVLRSGSQDQDRCMIRDEFFTGLMAEECPHLLIQKYRPVALYINAEYQGLYFLREKVDKHFLARHLGGDADSTSCIMSVWDAEFGRSASWYGLLNYAIENDLKDAAAYKYVSERADLEGLIDWKLGQIYTGNTDIGNIRFVHSSDPAADGRWHFVYYDLDATWVSFASPSKYLRCGGGSFSSLSHNDKHNVLAGHLLESPAFRELLLQRLSHHLRVTFHPNRTTKYFDQLVATIRPEMKRDCDRWSYHTYAGWEKQIADFRAKLLKRPKDMLNAFRQDLQITAEEEQKYFKGL